MATITTINAETGEVITRDETPEEEAARVGLQQQAATDLSAQQTRDAEAATLRQQLRTLAQSAVGVALDQLTAGQRNALIAILLMESGGVASNMTVKPLSEWAG